MSLKQYLKRGVRYILHGQPIINTTATIVTVSPSQVLKGKTVLITGGSRGIGYALAKKFISEGAKVMITGRHELSLQKVASELNCLYWCMDVSDIKTITEQFKTKDSAIGGFNCLINNAGISLHEKSFFDVTEEQFDEQLSINLKGSYFLTQFFTGYCKSMKRDNVKVIFMSSQRGTFVDDIPYGLTKVAINSLVQSLAYNLIEYGIRVYGIAPGVTKTDLIDVKTKEDNLYYEINRTKRIYLPEEIAEVAVFLLTDVANSLAGNILICDEGRTINTRKRK